MNLTTHFTLEEMTFTQIRGESNLLPAELMQTMHATAERMEIVRGILGNHPIVVTSGYRSPAINRAVRGAKNSAHMRAEAVDFLCPGFGTPAEICRKLSSDEYGLQYDQLIYEINWVHIAYSPKMRRQLLVAYFEKGGTRYTQAIIERAGGLV